MNHFSFTLLKNMLISFVQEASQHIFQDRVWHTVRWATLKKYNIGQNLIQTIKGLYTKATSAVLAQDRVGEWVRTQTVVRQCCLRFPTRALRHSLCRRTHNDKHRDHSEKIKLSYFLYSCIFTAVIFHYISLRKCFSFIMYAINQYLIPPF